MRRELTSPVVGFRLPRFFTVEVNVAAEDGEEGVGQNAAWAIERVAVAMPTFGETQLYVSRAVTAYSKSM